jgi:transcriptional regulator with XRE-family HTH domain
MSLKDWENKVLAEPGAAERVDEIETELRVASGLTALREQAGLSQSEVARRIGVSQPRVAAIERSDNVTLDLLSRYVSVFGGRLEISVVRGRQRTPLFASARTPKAGAKRAGRASTAQPKRGTARRPLDAS